MKESGNNPGANQLPAGVNEEQLRDAIAGSGYPLQTMVAQRLRSRFDVDEEWAFLDPDSAKLRALDVRARRSLYKELGVRVRPQLDLLVECKQSELPFVFFVSVEPSGPVRMPLFSGLRTDSITLRTDDDRSTWEMDLALVLEMRGHAFYSAPANSHSFAKVVRKGKALELSGSDAYQSIVLPLAKALRHLPVLKAPPDSAAFFDCNLGVGLAVLDAPMVAVSVDEDGHHSELVPWVRVTRHEYVAGAHWLSRSETLAIDIVHSAFLDSYIDEHLIPFASEFATRILRHADEVATGKGFASGLGRDSWTDLESRLRPR